VRLNLRFKLWLIIATATLALIAVVGGGLLIAAQQTRSLLDVESRLVPRLRVAPELESGFDRLRQHLRDSVAAQDPNVLESAAEPRDRLLDLLDQNALALGTVEIVELRSAIRDYYDVAHSVSKRMIAGETGEHLVQEIELMQQRDRRVNDAIARNTALSEPELAQGFAAVRKAATQADRFRLLMGVAGLALVIALTSWLTRDILRSLHTLSEGFSRFTTGHFNEAIPVLTKDELGDVAIKANAMASNLLTLNQQRDRTDWMKASVAGLSHGMRGDLSPIQLAQQALHFLVQRTEAVAGALYVVDTDNRKLRLYGQYAHTPEAASAEADDAAVAELGVPADFELGQGLVGQAALNAELSFVDSLPDGYFKVRSALGEASPKALALLPLRHRNRCVGVVELAFFSPCSEAVRELLAGISEPLALSVSIAMARAAQSALLKQTQEQAAKLLTQEEELRTNNQELRSQQAELQRANEELISQRSALREQNAELEETRRRVQQKAEELAQVSSYKSQFLANMSHELRTPLNSMLLLSSLLSENAGHNLTAKQVEYAKTVHASGKDLLALINQVLDLAKIEAGKQDIDVMPLRLVELTEQARRVFEPLAEQKGLLLDISLEESLPSSVSTDRLRVERIITNLLGNAIKFTSQGKVALHIGRPGPNVVLPAPAQRRDDWIAITVTDTGIGIAPEARERVFAPFEQGEARLDRRYGGTGLGLAIARESARLLGGDLLLQDTEGSGSTFTCLLPRTAPDDVSANVTTHASKPAPLDDDRGKLKDSDRHLLIIEDDPVLADQLIEMTRARNFKVVVACTGEEGLSLARKYRPHGIILDIGLPDIDGWSVMDRLKSDATTRSIPVHFVSGIEAPQKGLAMGAVGYLVKPVRHSELFDVVRLLTPGGGESSKRVLIVEDDQHGGESLVALLEAQGVEATHVTSAAQAMVQLSQSRFGCMILDLGLPDMDGLGLLDTLSSQDFIIPKVVIHTGRALRREETQRLEQYAQAVILKDGNSAERLLEEIQLFLSHVELTPRPSEILDRGQSLSLEGLTLLLVDDDMRTVYAVSALLRGRGAKVLVADSGQVALDTLDQTPNVDIVLMDIMMPGMDGYEAMRHIRLRPQFADLPVLALTAKAMKGERERCVDAGASDYLPKPLDSERLLSLLATWIPRKAAQ
jgi:CheY-like chemotaxis protein